MLAAEPNSRLLLHARIGNHRERIREVLAVHGLDPHRLEFVDHLRLQQYMEQYHRIDIALDPFPYVGGTTTCDALWMGVPVVTLKGQTAVGRAGFSMLMNLGLPELVAQNPARVHTNCRRSGRRLAARGRSSFHAARANEKVAADGCSSLRAQHGSGISPNVAELVRVANVTIQQAMQIAAEHHQAGRLAEAEKIYRQVLSQQPRNAGALHLLGVIALQVGRPDTAIELIRQAIALNAVVAEFHNNLGNALRDRQLLDEAIAAYRQALRLKPDLAVAHYNLGNALRDQGLLDEAIAAYRQGLRVRPDDAVTHLNLGNVLRDKGLLDEAIAAYRHFIRLKPDYAEAYNNLGVVLSNKGLHDEAIAACRHSLRLKPDYAEAYNNLGNALRKMDCRTRRLPPCTMLCGSSRILPAPTTTWAMH